MPHLSFYLDRRQFRPLTCGGIYRFHFGEFVRGVSFSTRTVALWCTFSGLNVTCLRGVAKRCNNEIFVALRKRCRVHFFSLGEWMAA
jgi:hypothetical protein